MAKSEHSSEKRGDTPGVSPENSLVNAVHPMTALRTRGRLFGVVVRPLQAFLRLEAASGLLLLFAAACALLWANLDGDSYRQVVGYQLVVGAGKSQTNFSLAELVNDGLMTLFFFVVGMEIKRELVVGELDTVPKASLPAIAAIGGMIVPAGIFLAINGGGPGAHGWGIPVATDIAFCVGVLTLLQKRVPRALIVFVTALAIFDDIGGILVIAFFYGHGIEVGWLLAATGVTLLLAIFNWQYVRNGIAYAVVGGALWYALHRGGIHATIAGVITGLMIPARPPRSSRHVIRELTEHVTRLDRNASDDELGAAEILMIEEKLEELEAPLHRFVHLLHPYVAYFTMPVFALANSGVSLRGVGLSILATPVALGVAIGLLVGKQLGIFASAALTVRLGFAPMPGGAPMSRLYGASIVAGIGFTVALFIATLAYREDPVLLAEAKAGILVGSLASGVLGAAFLRLIRG
ncbi:MAG TPA: Na+/H+ antiporter NhaA [Polyangiaceae bacterium]|nr:Na+/H+ antiporter NhaA [Polyangiaceae bacterium]